MKLTNIIALSVGFITLLNQTGKAQVNTMYSGFDGLPQSQYINPGQNTTSKLHIGVPLLSGININYENSAFSPLDLFEKGTDINKNLDHVIGDLKTNDYLNIKTKLDILDIGFKTKIGRFNFGAYSESNIYMDYPIELLKVIRFREGQNYLGDNLSFDKLNFEASSFIASYIGFQKEFMDNKLSIGVRYKHLVGLAHGYSEKMNAGITRIDTHTLGIKADTEFRTTGLTDLENGDIGKDNRGHAIDFGLTYDVTEDFTIGASVIDLGSINWGGEHVNTTTSGEYNYTGIDVDLNSDDPFEGATERILDDIEENLNYRTDTLSGSYSRSLQTQFLLSASYTLGKKHTFSGIYTMKKAYENNLHNFSANYYFAVTRALQLISGISLNESQTKIGAGMALRLGYLQLYMMTDNVIKTIDYGRLRNVNLSFGVNINVPEKKEKGEKDNETWVDRKIQKKKDKLKDKKEKEDKKAKEQADKKKSKELKEVQQKDKKVVKKAETKTKLKKEKKTISETKKPVKK